MYFWQIFQKTWQSTDPTTSPLMEPVTTTSPEADMTAQMAQLNLQTNGTLVTPVNGTTGIPTANNNNSAPRQRTGIPRYAIPYRRPDEKPAVTVAKTNGSGGIKSPATNAATSPDASESAVSDKPAAAVSAIPRGRNGFRADSVGDDSSAISGGVNSYKGARAASVDVYENVLAYLDAVLCVRIDLVD
ncbi:hypothetical protein ACTXT7_016876 [Hymenolepis weldensis]